MAMGATPIAPTNCVAIGVGDASGGAVIFIRWNDNSTDETHWKIEYSENGGEFALLATGSSNTTTTTGSYSIPLNGASSNTTYQFRISASDGSAYSATTTSGSITTTVFTLTAAPVPGQTAVNLSWSNVQNESGYNVFYLPADGSLGSQYSYLGSVSADTTACQIAAPTVEATKTYNFIVQPYFGSISNGVGESNIATATVDGMTSKTGTSSTPGASFSHTFTQLSGSGSAVVSRALTGVPSGLSFDSSTGVLSGVYPAVGNYTLSYTVNFANGGVLTQAFYIRVRPVAGAPVIGTIIPAWTAALGASRDTPLAGTFTDAEAESAVRVSTTLGDMDFILFNTATPATVTNFMSYVNGGKYTDVAFHRSIAGFVIQGGGFKGAGTDSDFTSVVTNPTVVNEPGIGNVLETISMAKLGGDPNSATSQFFVSMGDNRANLDNQNGGFTVFGRVAGDGMAVATAISNLPIGNYNLFLNGSGTATLFTDFPLNVSSMPATMDQTKLVKMNSVTTIPTLSYSITGNSNPAVASASIVSGQLHLVGLTVGQTTVTLSATDLDNLTTSQSVTVNISNTFATWAAGSSFPGGASGLGQDPDGDGWNNLQEFAFLGNPALSSQASGVVFSGIVGVAPADRFLTLTFPVRKFTQGLSCAVEANNGLSGTWTEIWKSADGFGHSQVISAVDQTDRTVVKIRDSAAIGGQLKRFLRLRVVQE